MYNTKTQDLNFVENMEKKTRKRNGEGSIHYNEKRKSYVLQCTFVDYYGKSYRKSFYGKSEKECNKKKQKYIRDIAMNKVENKRCAKSEVTLCRLVYDAFERDFKFNRFSEAAYARKLDSLKVIQNSQIGNVPVYKITDDMIDDFLLYITKYSENVLKKIYAVLKFGFKLAVQKGIIVKNPLDNPDFKKPNSSKPTKKINAFTIEEQEQFIIALEQYPIRNNKCDYRYQMLIELYTGMRMGEVNALTLDDVDLRNKIVHVRKTVTRGLEYKETLSNCTKTKKGMRDIPLNDIAISVFQKAIAEYKENKFNLLFYDSVNDKIITTNQVNESFKRICKKFNIKNGTNQHMLRHTFATRCIEAGIDALVLKEWLGHTDVSVTLNTYCDVFAKLNDKKINLFQNYLKQNLLNVI